MMRLAPVNQLVFWKLHDGCAVCLFHNEVEQRREERGGHKSVLSWGEPSVLGRDLVHSTVACNDLIAVNDVYKLCY